MRKADIVVGEAYAVGRPNGMPRYWDRGLAVRLDAPRRVSDEGGWRSHIVNDGVGVRYDSGRSETVPLLRIIKPWEVHAVQLAESLEDEERLKRAHERTEERAELVVAALATAGFPASRDGGKITMRVEMAEMLLPILAMWGKGR